MKKETITFECLEHNTNNGKMLCTLEIDSIAGVSYPTSKNNLKLVLLLKNLSPQPIAFIDLESKEKAYQIIMESIGAEVKLPELVEV